MQEPPPCLVVACAFRPPVNNFSWQAASGQDLPVDLFVQFNV